MAKKRSAISTDHVISTLFYIRQLADALVTVLMEREGVTTVSNLPGPLLLEGQKADCPPTPPRPWTCEGMAMAPPMKDCRVVRPFSGIAPKGTCPQFKSLLPPKLTCEADVEPVWMRRGPGDPEAADLTVLVDKLGRRKRSTQKGPRRSRKGR